LGQLDHQEPEASQARLDQRDLKDLRERMVSLDYPETQDPRVTTGSPELQVLQEILEPLDHLVTLEPSDQRERRDHLDQLEGMVHKVHRVLLVRLEVRANEVLQGSQDPQDLMDPQAPSGTGALLETLGALGAQETQETLERRVPSVRWDHLVLRVNRETQAAQVPRDRESSALLANQDRLGIGEHRDHQDNKDQTARLDLSGTRAQQAFQDL
jgi:hypothetical protein